MNVGQFAEMVKEMRRAQRKAAGVTVYTQDGRRAIKEAEIAENAVDDALAARDLRIREAAENYQMELSK